MKTEQDSKKTKKIRIRKSEERQVSNGKNKEDKLLRKREKVKRQEKKTKIKGGRTIACNQTKEK